MRAPYPRDGDSPAQLDFVELLSFLMTLPPHTTFYCHRLVRDGRKLGPHDAKFGEIICNFWPCRNRVLYVVRCLKDAPLFALDFVSGCRHFDARNPKEKLWVSPTTQGQLRDFRHDTEVTDYPKVPPSGNEVNLFRLLLNI
jgi:hypothetical protein